ncbi:MAG: NTP transferase domain-containing protein [Verrucomicrobiota bacterium]|jgi:spore coat polysaccharide biosynthesis protein SpsF
MALNGKKVAAVIEVRMTSSRLPGKPLLTAGGKPLLQILVERLRRVRRIDQIAVATTVNAADDPIVELAGNIGAAAFRGSEQDVLRRVCDCLKWQRADVCVEITGDCPLADPAIVDEALDAFTRTPDCVYVSNSDPHRSVPAGLDAQVFSAYALFQLERETSDPVDREHVSHGFYRPESGGRWRPVFIKHASTAGAEFFWLSLDYREDYELIKALHEDLGAKNENYGAREIIAWVRAHPGMHERCLKLRPGWGGP